MKATDYKNNGYTHVLVEINNFANEPSIAKGFKNYKDMRRYRDNMNLQEYYSNISRIMTVNQAIKKGYWYESSIYSLLNR